MRLTHTDYRHILEQICGDPRYLENLDWGKPRRGHPEGTVRAHILELEDNLELLRGRLSNEEYWKLKVLIHVHDTFKPDSRTGVSIFHAQSHASVAARFLDEHCHDYALRTMVQRHDEPYAIWRRLRKTQVVDEERLTELVHAIVDWDLFLAFLIVDGCTVGKSREPLEWTIDQITSCRDVRFDREDLT